MTLSSNASGHVYTKDQVRSLSSGGGGAAGFMGGPAVVENHYHFHGPVFGESDQVRWVAQKFNQAGVQGLPLHIQGRPL